MRTEYRAEAKEKVGQTGEQRRGWGGGGCGFPKAKVPSRAISKSCCKVHPSFSVPKEITS